MNFSAGPILLGVVLVLVQLLAAAPWLALAFLTREDLLAIRRRPFSPWVMQAVGIALALAVVVPPLFLFLVQDREALEVAGRVYGAALQVQLTVDAFILGFGLLLSVWPKGGAVALAAFREGVRQWLFWLLALLAAGLMFISIFVPYFTFGEDYLMVKRLGYDTILLAAVLFGALTAALSIADEIEGRTAVTLMSKPVSRRQFLLGKFAGIALAGLFMLALLGSYFEGVLLAKHWWDRLGPLSELSQVKESTTAESIRIGVVATPSWVTGLLRGWGLATPSTDFLRGVGQWLAHSLDTLPGLVLGFSQVMVLVALAVALAIRVPMVVNLTTVLVVYFLANLTPVLVARARQAAGEDPNSAVPRLLGFVAQVFDTILPDLGTFSLNPVLLSEAPPPPGLFAQYVASVTLYGVLYTVIVLLFGLILFEDRDLA
jgi:hypothetical protein